MSDRMNGVLGRALVAITVSGCGQYRRISSVVWSVRMVQSAIGSSLAARQSANSGSGSFGVSNMANPMALDMVCSLPL